MGGAILGKYMLMWLLRYFLLATTLLMFGLLAHSFATLPRAYRTPDQDIFALAGMAALVLNFIYVFVCPPFGTRPKSRLLHLGGLWLDAKERELSERAQKGPPQSN
jgi:hypothetical protein